MARAIRVDMRPREQGTLDTLVGQPFLLANLYTHNSPVSLGERRTVNRASGVAPSSREPSVGLLHEALAIGYEALSLVAYLVADREQLPVLDGQIDQDRRLFRALPAGGRLGRNQLCTCGSGIKSTSNVMDARGVSTPTGRVRP